MIRATSALRALAVTLVVGATPLGAARAQDDYEGIKKAAEAMLDKHCARCHQVGKLVNKDTPSKGFGNVLHLDELLQNPAMVKPGVPEGSKIYNMVVNSQMPYDVYQEGKYDLDSPTKEEILALRKWIEASKVTCSPKQVATSTTVLKYIADDLRTLQKSRIMNTRYVTLGHFVNGCASDDQLEAYRQGVVKFLNSISNQPDVVRGEAIDPDKTILRFNLDDLGLSPADWDMLLASYPYGNYSDDPLYKFAVDVTRSGMPYVRGDWLIFYAAQPPFYDKLLRLPTSFQALERKFGISTEANIAKYRVQRAGFQNSGVSQHNRLIERHSVSTGYFWTSYDFGGDSDEQSFFAHPTGPHGPDGFRHDGGETIFSLPNGFQAYYLNTAKGDQISKGPTNIVRDPKRRDQAVTNGVSCMSCHDQGIKFATDEVREHVLGAKSSFPKHIRDAVKELYPEKAVMDKIQQDDQAKFKAAMAKAGLDPTLQLNGDEPVTAVSRRYEQPVDFVQAAAELGITTAEMEKGLIGTNAAVVRRLKLGNLPREQFESAYADLVKALTDDVMYGKGTAQVAYNGAPAPVTDYLAAPSAEPGRLALSADKAVYYQNDVIVLSAQSSFDCFLTLVNVDQKGKATIIFPNKFQPDNRISANREFRFGDTGAPFRLRLADKGVETVVAECSADRNANPDLATDYKAGGLTDMGNYVEKTVRATISREIKVEGALPEQPPAQAAAVKPVIAKLKNTVRTAIKVQVQ